MPSNESGSVYVDRYEKDAIVIILETQVLELKKSQENLLNQVCVLKVSNVMYHEANLKQLFELNKANNKVMCFNIGAERIDKMLSSGKPYGHKSDLSYV